MAWMISTTGQTTMPRQRLTLGSSPNYNIDWAEKTVNNGIGIGFGEYGTGWATGMPNMPMPYGYGYGNYEQSGLDKATGIMTLLSGITQGIGAITNAIIPNGKAKVETATDDGTQKTENRKAENTTNSFEEQMAEINAQSKKNEQTIKDLRAQSELYQQGITKNTDGTFTLKVKDKSGKEISFKASSPEEAKQTKKEVTELLSLGGNITPEGKFTFKVNDGTTIEATSYSELNSKVKEYKNEHPTVPKE